LSFGKRDLTNTPQVKLHRIIVKLICHFVSQMILYLGLLLQCIGRSENTLADTMEDMEDPMVNSLEKYTPRGHSKVHP
jgi:hypothetical protein